MIFFDSNFNDKMAATGLKGNAAIKKMAMDAKVDPSVRLLADFYGQVATWMQNSLCDIETTCVSFRQQVKRAAE